MTNFRNSFCGVGRAGRDGRGGKQGGGWVEGRLYQSRQSYINTILAMYKSEKDVTKLSGKALPVARK